MDNNIDTTSMEEKMYKMHNIAFQIENTVKSYNEKTHNYEIKHLTDDEIDSLFAIVDGLTEKYILDRMIGHCSLQTMLDNPPEKLESIIDDKILMLLQIAKKYSIEIVQVYSN